MAARPLFMLQIQGGGTAIALPIGGGSAMKIFACFLGAATMVLQGIVPLIPAHAQAPDGLGDLIGIRGSSAESALNSRGYRPAGNRGAASLWWRESPRNCVSMYVDNGRVQSLQGTSDSDCGKGGGGGNGAAAAIAGLAAIGLIAALASHHSKTDDSHANGQHDGEYTRGYNDALYGGRYDNQDSEGYHEGFLAGDAERQNRLASNSPFVRSLPPAAQNACAQRGDGYLNMPSGTTIPVSTTSIGGGDYQVVVAAGHYRARCTVSSNGQIRSMDPY